jgi:4-amino-4-deoxy-L-arabinose transferase-like glycosyltransferase
MTGGPLSSEAERTAQDHTHKVLLIALAAVFLFGAFLRIYPTTNYTSSSKVDPQHPNIRQIGFDEDCYRRYLMSLDAKGLTSYPELAHSYLVGQPKLEFAILPPMRLTFLSLGYFWQLATSASPLASLHAVSCLFTVLAFIVGGLFAWRLGGLTKALGVTALMSCAPLQIQLAQRAYIDGVFVFWTILTLWLLWENLRAARHYWLLAAYTVSLAFMVMTKENAAFVFAAIIGIMILNRWLRFGEITPWLVLATFIGPLLGLIGLTLAAGGIHTLIDIYRLNIERSHVLPYAIKTGDGPWFRYVLDLMLISPLITLLALGGFLNIRPADKPAVYFALFIAFTYLIMANVPYGMNLRYASIWDMPLRWLAFAQLSAVDARMPRRFGLYFTVSAVTLLCVVDLTHYFVFFARHGLYDPIPEAMLRILNILK